MPLIPAVGRQGLADFLSLRSAWFIDQVQGQPVLGSEGNRNIPGIRTVLRFGGNSYNPFLLSLTLKLEPMAEAVKFRCLLELKHGPFVQLHLHHFVFLLPSAVFNLLFTPGFPQTQWPSSFCLPNACTTTTRSKLFFN